MPSNTVKMRIDPSFPVVATGDAANGGNFCAVCFQHPLIDEVSGSVAVFTLSEVVVAPEKPIDIFMGMPARKISEVDLLKPAFIEQSGVETKVPAGFVLPGAVVSLNKENAAKGTSNPKRGQVIENSSETDVGIAYKPVKVQQENRVLAMLNEAPNMKMRTVEVILPAFRIPVY